MKSKKLEKKNDQVFENFKNLIHESRQLLKNHPLNRKLWRRFWKTIVAYNDGKSYSWILKSYFDVNCSENVNHHRRITNSNIEN